ncbi:AAA family ATPase [Methanobrevibacter sp.]|uniref:AAA family ATPase n=1 Tax=Methanobrevibacter sp. TaxID=66852 RepID=UPI0038904DAB
MKLHVGKYGPIYTTEISIKRINVVGGVNHSGKTTASKLIYCYVKSEIYGQSLDELMANEGLNNTEYTGFSGNPDISDIFFIEEISILDLTNPDFFSIDHIRHLLDALQDKSKTDNTEIISKIQNIIENNCTLRSSAGMKQIGIIQMLLENGSLKENSFLIIDEPESNLHPSWQVKFAQILTLLAKDLNIYVYLNSHSPIFIEAMSLYAQYYDLLDSTAFYLTEEGYDGYVFKRINPKNMGEIYENLTQPYDDLDKLKAKILFKE